MRVLLTFLAAEQPSLYRFFELFQRRPPLGVLLLHSLLREKGFDAEFFDQRLEGTDRDGYVERVLAGGYDVIGIHVASTIRRHHGEYIAALRAVYDGVIIVGGPDAGEGGEFYIEQGADIAVVGEAEHTLVEILERLGEGREVRGVPGTIVRDPDGAFHRAENRPLMSARELDDLPLPTWTHESTRKYHDALVINHQRPAASIITSRGCPFRCSFCDSHRIWSREVRQRSVESVMREIDMLVENLGVRYLYFHDDIFGLKPEWVLEFCSALKSRPYRLRWMAILHPLAYGSRRAEIYRAMAEVGLDFVSFGAQSADPGVLRAIRRSRHEIQALAENVAVCREVGIATALTYIFGLPGDTPETVEEAIDFCLETRPHLVDFHPLFYLPGTQIDAEYPNKDGNPYSLEVQREWCNSARRRFYLSPRTIARLLGYVVRENPGYLTTLMKIALFSIPDLLFASKSAQYSEIDPHSPFESDSLLPMRTGTRGTTAPSALPVVE